MSPSAMVLAAIVGVAAPAVDPESREADPPDAASQTAPPEDADPESTAPSVAPTEPDPDPDPVADPAPDPDPAPNPAPDPAPIADEVAAGAVGGQGYAPLPAAPPPVDPSTIDPHPWRGRGWFDVVLGMSVSLGGRPPGYGNVLSGLGGVAVGWRVHRIVGLATGVNTFIHDAADRFGRDELGNEARVTGFGRVTIFELPTVRLFVPLPRRIEPRFDIATGLGPYRPPFAGDRRLAGMLRLGAGFDAWLGPTFSLSLEASYRLLAIARTVGHGLQTTVGLGVHW